MLLHWGQRKLARGIPEATLSAGQDYCTERGEAKENKAEDGVDEAEEDRADAVGDEANDDDQRGEHHQAGAGHQDSPPGGAVAQD